MKIERQNLSEADISNLWQICAPGSFQPESFAIDVQVIAQHYRPGPQPLAVLPAKKRGQEYAKLKKAIANFRTQLEEQHAFISHEIDATSIDHEPDTEGDQLPWLDEGLSYGEYVAFGMLDDLNEYETIVLASETRHRKPQGKPKQNENLEQAIQRLGEVFERYSGQAPMKKYQYDELDKSQPFKGRFFDLLYTFFWTINGREYPSGAALGQASRRTFKLMK